MKGPSGDRAVIQARRTGSLKRSGLLGLLALVWLAAIGACIASGTAAAGGITVPVPPHEGAGLGKDFDDGVEELEGGGIRGREVAPDGGDRVLYRLGGDLPPVEESDLRRAWADWGRILTYLL